MKEKIRNILPKSEFAKNAITLISGSSIAQILPVAISPILSRIYSSEDFGVLALFMAISSIFGIIANGRYELAVILPKKDSDAINIMALGVFISSFFSLLLLIFVIIFHDYIVVWLDNDDISSWLYVAPSVIFLIGFFKMLNYYNTRLKEYKNISKALVLKSTGTVILQMGLFFVEKIGFGLLSGFSAGHLFGNIGLLKVIIRDKETLKCISKKEIIKQAKRYSRFPKLTMPASLANVLSYEVVNILISKIFSIATLGNFSFANRVLRAPSSFIGNSIGQIYFQEASDEKKNSGCATKTFKSVVRKLSIGGLVIFTILFFTSEWLFVFIFGSEWGIAGTYAKILSPFLFVQFVVSPVSVSLSLFEKQHLSLYWQLGLLLFSLLSITIAFVLNLGFIHFLYIFVLLLSVYYLVFLFILYKVVKNEI